MALPCIQFWLHPRLGTQSIHDMCLMLSNTIHQLSRSSRNKSATAQQEAFGNGTSVRAAVQFLVLMSKLSVDKTLGQTYVFSPVGVQRRAKARRISWRLLICSLRSLDIRRLFACPSCSCWYRFVKMMCPENDMPWALEYWQVSSCYQNDREWSPARKGETNRRNMLTALDSFVWHTRSPVQTKRRTFLNGKPFACPADCLILVGTGSPSWSYSGQNQNPLRNPQDVLSTQNWAPKQRQKLLYTQ